MLPLKGEGILLHPLRGEGWGEVGCHSERLALTSTVRSSALRLGLEELRLEESEIKGSVAVPLLKD